MVIFDHFSGSMLWRWFLAMETLLSPALQCCIISTAEVHYIINNYQRKIKQEVKLLKVSPLS